MDFSGDSLSLATLLYGVAVIFSAYLIRGIAGFGSALVAVPLLAMRLPLVTVVPVICLLDYAASVTHGIQNRALIRWRDLLPLLPSTLAGVLTGLTLLTRFDSAVLAVWLGAFVCAYAIYFLSRLPMPAGNRFWSVPAGFLGGFVGVLFGTGGPFYVMYLTARRFDKGAFRATVATIFVIDGGLRLLAYLGAGLYTASMAWGVAAALPLAAVGLVAGGRIHSAVSQQRFVRLVGLILLGSGFALLLKYGA